MSLQRSMFEEIRRNKFLSYIIMLGFLILIGILGGVFGWLLGSPLFGLILAAFIGIVYSLVAYYSGDRMILRMSGAVPVTKEEYPYLYHIVEALAISAGLKKPPKVYVIRDSALNAFATGRDPEHSSITVTTGLLEKLNRQELEGVIAHEMSHIKNYDIRMMMLAAVLVGVVVLLSDFMLRSFLWGGMRGSRRRDSRDTGPWLILLAIILAILAPLFAQMVRLAVSRRREYLADASAAALTRYPPGLASALEKIKNDPDPLVDNANRAIAHLFISNPFRRTRSYFATLFSTHPPIEERIRRLRAM